MAASRPKKLISINVQLPEVLVTRLRVIAKRESRSTTGQVAHVINRWLCAVERRERKTKQTD